MNISPVLLMVGLLVATLQAVRHGDGASLWRVYLGVAPACVLGDLRRPSVRDAHPRRGQPALVECVGHRRRSPSESHGALTSLSSVVPAFGLFVLAVAVVVGTWLLWCELIIRAVILTLLLVLVPVIVPLATFPAGRRLGWRLAETFIAVAASKFLIVITLTLGFDELHGDSATQVITGAVTLMFATFSPYLALEGDPVHGERPPCTISRAFAPDSRGP